MFEERKNLLNNMDQKELRPSGKKNSYAERAKETDIHIGRIRDMLLARGASAKSANEPRSR
jgi:hypothetical protein